MTDTPLMFIGVDTTAGRYPFSWAALNPDCDLLALAGGEMDAFLSFLSTFPSCIVAINSPRQPNLGRVSLNAPGNAQSILTRSTRSRLCEYQLREHSISIPPTASREDACPPWMQMGFGLYRQLIEKGFSYFREKKGSRSFLETNSHATICSLLGHLPLPKPSLEGRMQRQLVLHTRGAGIRDPMDFFEEITRHKLLLGQLPMHLILASEELDAVAAALTAWIAVYQPDEVSWVGDSEEGEITLPVNPLLQKYQ